MTQQYKFINVIYKNWCSCSNWMQQSTHVTSYGQ